MAERSTIGLATVAVVALASACVFPSNDVTGLELSWLFFEVNVDDGDEGRHARTCSGARASQMEVRLMEEEDDDREGRFVYDCERGFQSVEDFQISASDVFVDLRPGSYIVDVLALDPIGVVLTSANTTVQVGSRGVTVQGYTLQPPPVIWTIDLAGPDSCGTVSFNLRYATPDTALVAVASSETDGEDGELEVTYRAGLASDRGLALGGEAVACADIATGSHVFSVVDRGEYVLDVTRDGESCPIALRIDRQGLRLPLDLASLPCTQ